MCVAVRARAYVGIGGGLIEDAGGLIGEMQWRGRQMTAEERGERREERREEKREESLAHAGGMTRERQAAEIQAAASQTPTRCILGMDAPSLAYTCF